MKKELSEAEVAGIKTKITDLFKRHAATTSATAYGLVDITQNSLQGKLYEAWIVATVCERLNKLEGLRIVLIGGSKLRLKQKGGPINRSYPYFEVYRGVDLIGELFTDTYFSTLSGSYKVSGGPSYGDHHELDIVLFRPGKSDIPQYTDVLLAIECKNTSIKKSTIREVLGFRRELSLLWEIMGTAFKYWPTNQVYAKPNSVHMLFCSDRKVLNFEDNCAVFGTLLEHLELP